MNPDQQKLVNETVEGAGKGGLLAAAASITSGIAIGTAPVKLLGLITIGTTTTISWPVVVSLGAAGAVLGGVTAVVKEGRKHRRIRDEFAELNR